MLLNYSLWLLLVSELVCRYGRFMSEVSYFICHEREIIDTIFNNLRKDRKVWWFIALPCITGDGVVLNHSILSSVAALRLCLCWILLLAMTAQDHHTTSQYVPLVYSY